MSRLFFNQRIRFIDILKIRLLTGIDFAIIMGEGMNTDRMPLSIRFLNQVVILRIASRHKKRSLDMVGIQNIQYLLRVLAGTVIKG